MSGLYRRDSAAPIRAGVFLLAALGWAGEAFAHDFWIEPSTFRPVPGAEVAVFLRVGVDFRGDPVPRSDARIVKFVLSAAAGETPVEGKDGTDPAGRVRVAEPGLSILAYRSNNARLDLPAEKFEEYLREEGLESARALRAERGETGKPSREHYSRCVKSLLAVGGALSGKDRALGLPLEIVAQDNPYASRLKEKLSFRLLYHGKPLKGALVQAIPQKQPDKKLTARSDAKGQVVFRLSENGVWLVKAVHLYPAPPRDPVDWESLWASLTFEIP